MRKDFYFREEENPEFIFKRNHLIRKKDNLEKTIYTMELVDNAEPGLYVILVNWLLERNILCFDKSTDELVWRVNPPRAIFKDRRNFWSEIEYDKKEPDRVYCYSIDRHTASSDIKTGKTLWEKSPGGPDFRDF
jgi:hypothetical protein